MLMAANGNEAVTLKQMAHALSTVGGGGGSSLKLFFSGNDTEVRIDYGDKGYILFILMYAGGQILMNMAVCMEGMTVDFGYSPDSQSVLYSVECMDGRCFLRCSSNDNFEAVWGMEVETY